jgi:hypothetical protein
MGIAWLRQVEIGDLIDRTRAGNARFEAIGRRSSSRLRANSPHGEIKRLALHPSFDIETFENAMVESQLGFVAELCSKPSHPNSGGRSCMRRVPTFSVHEGRLNPGRNPASAPRRCSNDILEIHDIHVDPQMTL